jgi:probable rRNA maturation factor
MSARFFEQEVKVSLKNKKKLSVFLDELVHRHLEGIRKVSLSYIFCNDDYLLQINRQFLDHDTFTDIITFDLSETETELRGEIYISTERVAENAQRYKAGFEQELHRVIFHGALHLCGFADKGHEAKKEMTRQEDACLSAYLGQ